MTQPLRQQNRLIDPDAVQQEASDPISSVWVNASAGSGKTKVLTERVMRLLLSGVKPEKILCLTYTRAGAAEMTNRITQKLSKWATCTDAELDNDLDALQGNKAAPGQRKEARRLFARVLSCPGGLRIRTIHSFCQEILSRFPIESGLPPHFALIDEQDAHIMHNEVLDDLLRDTAENPNTHVAQALKVLLEAQGEVGIIKMLQEVIHARGRLYDAVRSSGGEENYISKIRSLLELERTDTAQNLKLQAMSHLPEAHLRKLAAWLSEGSKTHAERSATLINILENPVAKRVPQFVDYYLLFLTKDCEPRKAFADSKTLKKYPEIQDFSEREAHRLIKILERIEAADIAQATESVLAFGGAFSKKLAERKAARAVLDYDDLILLTENLLQRSGIAPWILYKLDNGIDHILVDEAQDTSRAQWNIVQALTTEFYSGEGSSKSGPRTLFVVGDEKQSIFSFQNADPEAFLYYRDYFGHHLHEAKQDLKKIGLHTSFRSAPAILRAVDTIFAPDSVRSGVSSEPVTHSAFPNKDGTEKKGRVELWPLFTQIKDEIDNEGTWILPTDYEEDHDPQYELAQQIAKKIKSWISQNVILPGTHKPIAASDIMILLRRRGRFAPLMVRALKAHDVPVTGVDRMHLIMQLPVMDIITLLRFVLLPEDDLNLATLLRTPLIGLSEEQLMDLSIDREGTLWQSVKTKDAYKNVHDYLSVKLGEADFSTPFTFISHILNAPCPTNPISGRQALWSRLGEESLDPIEELLNEAQNFSRAHAPSLQKFLYWLIQSDKEIKRELDFGDQQTGGQVRIMTVHASKGLEAPIVFLPDTTALPRTTDLSRLQWIENDVAIFMPHQPKFGYANIVWQNARHKQIQEYRRLFYVALTRAANQLYICGWLEKKNEAAHEDSWYALAQNALQPLHDDIHIKAKEAPLPDIVFADAFLETNLAPLPLTPPHLMPVALPIWARHAAEASTLVKPLIPSQAVNDPAATPDAAFARGRIIHRLLQSIPDVAPEQRGAAIKLFLSQSRHHLDQTQRDEIASEIEVLINDKNFAPLFSTKSLAEAPLTGSLNGIPVFRQIDRLCLNENEVWIVDYKTNRPPPSRAEDIPAPYRQQLEEYRVLLREIYPDKKIRCFLLWTYTPRLMEISL